LIKIWYQINKTHLHLHFSIFISRFTFLRELYRSFTTTSMELQSQLHLHRSVIFIAASSSPGKPASSFPGNQLHLHPYFRLFFMFQCHRCNRNLNPIFFLLKSKPKSEIWFSEIWFSVFFSLCKETLIELAIVNENPNWTCFVFVVKC
jgi:hypothetical protein